VQVEYSPNGISRITDRPIRTDLPEPGWIIGCVAYMDTIGNIHHTKVLYMSDIPEFSVQEGVLLNPPFSYRPFKEFVMEDSDSD
jgi:hypothetical protein